MSIRALALNTVAVMTVLLSTMFHGTMLSLYLYTMTDSTSNNESYNAIEVSQQVSFSTLNETTLFGSDQMDFGSYVDELDDGTDSLMHDIEEFANPGTLSPQSLSFFIDIHNTTTTPHNLPLPQSPTRPIAPVPSARAPKNASKVGKSRQKRKYYTLSSFDRKFIIESHIRDPSRSMASIRCELMLKICKISSRGRWTPVDTCRRAIRVWEKHCTVFDRRFKIRGSGPDPFVM